MQPEKIYDYEQRLELLRAEREDIDEKIKPLLELKKPITKEINKIEYLLSREKRKHNGN